MFYNKDEVDSYLNCLKCKHRYDVPKCLPCGEVICQSCIQSILNDQSNGPLKCPFCQQDHMQPENGFATQKLFFEMLKLKPSAKYRGILVEELENTLSELNERIEYLKTHIENSEKKIKEHSKNIKKEIEASAQRLIDQVEIMKKNLFNTLESYEKKGLEDIKKTMGNFLEDSNQKFAEINELIKNPNIDKIKEATLGAADLMENIHKQEDSLNGFIEQIKAVSFIEKKYYFNEAFIGVLNFDCEKASSSDDESISDEIREVQNENQFNDSESS